MNTRNAGLVALLGAVLLVLGACRETPSEPSADGIVQTVRLDPAEPRKGEIVTVISTLENRGNSTKTVTHLICVLGLGGDLMLSMPPNEARCAAVSATAEFTPGKTLEFADRRVVDSPAGVYSLRVEHLVDPQTAVTVRVRVRD
jgi:hypothetical protein